MAFFAVALAASLPNLFVGISAALHKIPELSFGDVVGGNLVDLTLVIAIAALIAGGIPAESRMVQTSSIFTIIVALLPLILILDGTLGRIDGVILLICFAFYVFWLFSKEERFHKIYEENGREPIRNYPAPGGAEYPLRGKFFRRLLPPKMKEFKGFIKDVGKLFLGIILLVLSAEGIVRTALFLSKDLNLPLALVGILIVGLGNAIPETYFTIVLARSGQTWMILGDLMGAVMVPATLVLGIVALIYPITITDFSPFAIARIFLIIAALFFFFSVRSDRKITRKEGLFLLFIYILFLVVEILVR